MGLFRKNKTDQGRDPEQLVKDLADCGQRRDFFQETCRAFVFFIKEFALNLPDIGTQDFHQAMDRLNTRLAGQSTIKETAHDFETAKETIVAFAGRQKACIRDREKELRDIIDLLTKALTTLDADNRRYYQNVSQQAEKIEQISLLDDIRALKDALKSEVDQIRKTLAEKTAKDRHDLESLASQVKHLSTELERVRSASEKDGLTGALNRRSFDQLIHRMVEQAAVMGTGFAVIMVDIDDFKVINDTYGHPTGDRVIMVVVDKCRKQIRSDDFLARYGGDEFALLLPAASLRNAVKKARNIRKAICNTRYSLEDFAPGLEITFTVSMGAAVWTRGDTVQSLVRRADQALYLAKREGKNGVATEKDLKGKTFDTPEET